MLLRPFDLMKNLVSYIRRESNQENIAAYTMLLPALVIIGLFLLFPAFYSLYLSFHEWKLIIPQKPFVGFQNYKALFSNGLFWKAMWNTVYYVIGVVPTQTVIALFLAMVANRAIKGKKFFKIAYFLPSVTSSVVISIIFLHLYAKRGLINYVLSLVGIQGPNWLEDPTFSLEAIMGMNVWTTAGYFMVIFLAGLQNIPDTYYEAASVDGAGPREKFFKITLPLLKPQIYFVVVMGMIGCFQVFDQVYVMTSGGPANSTTTIVYYIYKYAFEYFQMGYAAAAAFILFVIIFTATLIQRRYLETDISY